MPDGKEWTFFAADPKHPNYDLVQNVCNSQSYVAEFALRDYPVPDDAILIRGPKRGTPRSTPSTSGSTTSAGRRSASGRTLLRGDPARDPAPALPHERHRLSAREEDVHGRVGTARRDAALRPPRVGLLPVGYARRPAIPSLQPGREDEGDDAGEAVIDLLWTSSRRKGSRRRWSSRWPRATSARCRSWRDRPRQHRADPEVPPELLLRARRVRGRPDPLDAADDAFLFDQGPAHGLSKIRFTTSEGPTRRSTSRT